MKKTVLTYGTLSAVIMTVMYILMCLARDNGHLALSQILTYSGVLVLFIMLLGGIKSYRDHLHGGSISLGNAFKAGLFISLITSLCSAIIWVFLYNLIFKDFMDHHTAALLDTLKTSGAPLSEIAAKKEEMTRHAALYDNTLYRAGIIFIQGFPVEVIMALVASFILKKK